MIIEICRLDLDQFESQASGSDPPTGRVPEPPVDPLTRNVQNDGIMRRPPLNSHMNQLLPLQDEPRVQLTEGALRKMIEEASARAAAEAVALFAATHHRERSPKTPQGSRTSSPTPDQESSRPTAPPLGRARERMNSRASQAEHKEKRRRDTNETHTMLTSPRVGSHIRTDQPTYPSRTHTHVENATPLAVLPPKRSPFSPAILAESLPLGVKITNLSEYDGTGDPQEHLDRFFAKADLYDLSDVAYSKIFRTTLAKRALSWFNQLSG